MNLFSFISPFWFFVVGGLVIYLGIYLIAFFVFSRKVQMVENTLITTFLFKVSKIPALIEVMRPTVADPSAFDSLIRLHSSAMIHKYETIYILLEHNARIQEEFMFLMKLSMQIPLLQKNEQFLYIREFIIRYERNIKNDFSVYNSAVQKWNRFVTFKNWTIIGLLLPGKQKEYI